MQTDYNTYESLRAILEKETPILIAQIRALYRELRICTLYAIQYVYS